MSRNKENDILETTLSIAEKGYREAYYFLQKTLYFLACLAGGVNMTEEALAWLKKAGLHVIFTVLPNTRHQFPEGQYSPKEVYGK